MSIFWIGGPEGIILPTEQVRTTSDNVYFVPGIIHGSEDYLIEAWGYNNEGTPEGERIGINYLPSIHILAWADIASESGAFDPDVFEELINEHAENFVVDNDGTGDFVSLNEVWGQAKQWSYADVIAWAKNAVAASV